MKRTVLVGSFLVFLAMLFVGVGFGVGFCELPYYEAPSEEEVQAPKTVYPCPKTLITDNDRCLGCHVAPSFRLKESFADEHLDYPSGVKILNYGTDDAYGYYVLTAISTNEVTNYLRYLDRHEIHRAIVEIYSPGGSLFAAWKIKGLFDEWIAEGNIVETRVLGFAASAGAIVFCAGSDGYRVANSQAELMFHELWTFKYLDISSPSDKEDEARVLRHLQDTINSWLATRGDLTKDELDARMRKKEYWINGAEAFEIGFVDRLIGKPKLSDLILESE